MKIKIVYPGKIKNSFAKTGFDEYIKRCRRFHKIETVSLAASHSKDKIKCVEEEAEKLLKYVGNEEYVLLDVGGKEVSTQEFADFVRRYFDGGHNLTFVVGGVFGVSSAVKKKANFSLSLSKMTFTHSMTLMIFAEQLYRAMKIFSGQPYDH